MHKFTNIQIHKYTNIQIHKYTNVQICKCTNAQIYKYNSNRRWITTKIQLRLPFQISPDRIHKHRNRQISRYTYIKYTITSVTTSLANPAWLRDSWKGTEGGLHKSAYNKDIAGTTFENEPA